MYLSCEVKNAKCACDSVSLRQVFASIKSSIKVFCVTMSDPDLDVSEQSVDSAKDALLKLTGKFISALAL